MASIVLLREKNTAAEVATVKASSICFKKADESTVDDTNAFNKPAVGSTRSYEKWLRLFISFKGPTNTITAPVFYTDGGNGLGTGMTLYIRTTNPSAFSTPAIPVNDSAGTNAFTYTSTSPKALDVANAGPYSGTNLDIADYIVFWLTIDSTVVVPGKDSERRSPVETLYFSWDET